MENKEFSYTYRALSEEQKREIADIRRRYSAPADTVSKLERLRRLDAKCKNLCTAISLVVGVLGCLIFGLGLTMILEWGLAVAGAAVCVVGVAAMVPAYPLYRYIHAYCRKTYGAEILRLSEELLGEDEEGRA